MIGGKDKGEKGKVRREKIAFPLFGWHEKKRCGFRERERERNEGGLIGDKIITMKWIEISKWRVSYFILHDPSFCH